MTFEEITGYAFLAGVALVVVGTLLLALFPSWGGFRPQGAEAEPQGALDKIVGALVEAFTSFLGIVVKMVQGKAGAFHPGQIFIAVGFLLALTGGLLWVVAQLV